MSRNFIVENENQSPEKPPASVRLVQGGGEITLQVSRLGMTQDVLYLNEDGTITKCWMPANSVDRLGITLDGANKIQVAK